MIEIDRLRLRDIMPPNLLHDPVVADLAQVLTQELQSITLFRHKLNLTQDLASQPEEVLDHLLWELHLSDPVEGLLLADTREKKENLIRSAVTLHRHKGTPFAIEKVLEEVKLKGEVEEWFQTKSEPFHFVVELQPSNDIGRIEDVRKMVMHYKNQRSWFDGFVILLQNQDIVILDDSYHYPVYYPTTGEFSGEKQFTQVEGDGLDVWDDSYGYSVEYPLSEKQFLQVESTPMDVQDDSYGYKVEYPVTGEMETLSKGFTQGEIGAMAVSQDSYGYQVIYPVCGEFYTEGETAQ